MRISKMVQMTTSMQAKCFSAWSSIYTHPMYPHGNVHGQKDVEVQVNLHLGMLEFCQLSASRISVSSTAQFPLRRATNRLCFPGLEVPSCQCKLMWKRRDSYCQHRVHLLWARTCQDSNWLQEAHRGDPYRALLGHLYPSIAKVVGGQALSICLTASKWVEWLAWWLQ